MRKPYHVTLHATPISTDARGGWWIAGDPTRFTSRRRARAQVRSEARWMRSRLGRQATQIGMGVIGVILGSLMMRELKRRSIY